MLIKEVFSKLYQKSKNQNNPTWQLKCDCKNPQTLSKVETLFQDELMIFFKEINASEQIMPIIHEHFDQIIERKNKSILKDQKEIFEYLQLIWGLCVVTQLNWDGEFVYAFDIFTKTVFDKVCQNGETFDLADIKIFDLLESNNEYIADSKIIIEHWFSQLYYYSKSFSGLNEWCEYFFEDVYYELNENLTIESHHPQLLSNLLSWAGINENVAASNAIRKIIKREYNLLEWTNDFDKNKIKFLLGLQLLLCYNYENYKKKDLFEELEKQNDLDPLEKMQAVFALCYNGENLIVNYELLKKVIIEFSQYLDQNYPSIINRIYQRARIFKSLLNNVLTNAIDLEKNSIIDELLILYHNVNIPQDFGTTIYFIINLKKRITFCLPSKNFTEVKDNQNLLIEIVDIENRAFNAYRLLRGGKTKEITPNDKPIGLPNSSYATAYENKLKELYNFSLIKNELDSVNSIIQFDFNHFPIQALMVKTIQRTLPINLSLSKKTQFTTVNKILYWSGNSMTSEIETEALNEIFNSKGIQFEIHNEESSSLDNFIKSIDIFNPDIIWVSSHGAHEHYEPNLSKIYFTETITLNIRDFKSFVNTKDKRRLIFLNVCEGGKHTQTGEFRNLGFPSLLVSNNQDVISHLWMADSRFAYVFGILIALGIIRGKNYFEAFEYALTIALDNKNSILKELDNFSGQLTNLKERIEMNEGTEWGNIITTGSAVYYI